MAFSTGYDMKNEFKFDEGLGKIYTIIAAVWSVFLLAGCVLLLCNSELQFLKIRNVHLTISAVITLHVYWVLCLVAYGLNGFFPCATEYWIMSIYLPMGIALFHISNTRLLHIAVLQRRYTSVEPLSLENKPLDRRRERWLRILQSMRKRTTYEKIIWLIILGMAIQLICALTIFLVSQKFHPGFGLIGTTIPETPDTKRECRRGWEWMPSIVWQFVWSWVFAPYLLWKVRHIQDTHGWRTQTALCCLAGLPASPMWILALYLPQMSAIDYYFIPPLWFVPSIFVIEAFMVFLPCWQILKYRRLQKHTLDIIAEWERNKQGTSFESDSTNTAQSPRRISYKSSALRTVSGRRAHSHMYTMAALEKALSTNPTPLLLFAALRDFTGENISFLNHVRDWTRDWQQPRISVFRQLPLQVDSELRKRQFVRAVAIYCSFVSPLYSRFPINISHNHLRGLEVLFQTSAAVMNVECIDCQNSVAPFDDITLLGSEKISTGAKDCMSTASTSLETPSSSATTEVDGRAASKQSTIVNIYKAKDLGENVPKKLLIPEGFGPTSFDGAAESVKYMVLTNTWPKFVDAGYTANLDKGTTTMGRFQERLVECGIGRSRNCSF